MSLSFVLMVSFLLLFGATLVLNSFESSQPIISYLSSKGRGLMRSTDVEEPIRV